MVRCWAVRFLTDGAWFHQSGYINSQNSSIRSADNPNALQENPLRWCSVGSVWNTNCETVVIWRDSYCVELSECFDRWNRMNCTVGCRTVGDVWSYCLAWASAVMTVRPLLLGETVTVENYRNVLTAGTEWTVLVAVEQLAMCDRTVWRGLRPSWPPDLRHLTSFREDFSKKEDKTPHPEPYTKQTNKLQPSCPALINPSVTT